MSILKRIFCNHEYEFDCNIPGPVSDFMGGVRTQYVCKKCGKYKLYRPYIDKTFNWKNVEERVNVRMRYK